VRLYDAAIWWEIESLATSGSGCAIPEEIAGESNMLSSDRRKTVTSPARQELETWRHDYNHFRPHSSLGNRTPAEMGAGSIGKPYWGMPPIRLLSSRPTMGIKVALPPETWTIRS
jgi:hypothetical protein